MPPRSRVTYQPIDVAALRAAADAGRTVRVGIVPMRQFPEGAAGRVRSVGDPAVDGAEFIRVEVSLGGERDVIPFAPHDLSPIKRTQAAPEPELTRPLVRARKSAPASSGAATERIDPRAARSRQKLGAPVRSPSTIVPVAEPAISEAPAAPAENPEQTPAVAPTEPTVPVTALFPAPERTKRPVRARRPVLTITISTTGTDSSEWHLEVKQGTRTVIESGPIHPARAWELVAALGHPDLNKVVIQALSEQRQQAQLRADQLVLELEAARAELAGFPEM